jgi:hypothetical protein
LLLAGDIGAKLKKKYMQALNLVEMGLSAISEKEIQETEGGFLPLIIIGCALLLSGCVTSREALKATHLPNCTDSTHSHNKK